jgi:hypothetical protein
MAPIGLVNEVSAKMLGMKWERLADVVAQRYLADSGAGHFLPKSYFFRN